MEINGKSANFYRKDYNNFTDRDDVKRFFKEVILTKIVKENDKENIATYLLTAFHQGGLMYPVASSMSLMLADNGLQPRAGNINRKLIITTTSQGFTVQEVYRVKEFLSLPTSEKAIQMANEDGVILPDHNNDYIVEAGALIDVNFSQNKSLPQITVKNNYISYGHKDVQSILDKRNYGQMLVDFLRNMLGLNSVKVSENVSLSTPEVDVTPRLNR